MLLSQIILFVDFYVCSIPSSLQVSVPPQRPLVTHPRGRDPHFKKHSPKYLSKGHFGTMTSRISVRAFIILQLTIRNSVLGIPTDGGSLITAMPASICKGHIHFVTFNRGDIRPVQNFNLNNSLTNRFRYCGNIPYSLPAR